LYIVNHLTANERNLQNKISHTSQSLEFALESQDLHLRTWKGFGT